MSPAPADLKSMGEHPGTKALRVSLTRLTGSDGYAALMRRALRLASSDLPALKQARSNAQGNVEGIDSFATPEMQLEAAVQITAHMLGLLIGFIGEALTRKLVREAWPEASQDDLGNERGSS